MPLYSATILMLYQKRTLARCIIRTQTPTLSSQIRRCAMHTSSPPCEPICHHAPDGEHSEEPTGTLFSRRRALRLLGGTMLTPLMGGAFSSLAGCGIGESDDAPNHDPLTGTCVVRPQLTEGPYYVDTDLIRSNIRDEKNGVQLDLTVNVSRISNNTCSPLRDAIVDVWHADALGNYSGVGDHQDESFLRGIQRTDAEGTASFTTIYPGWYPGRAVHIHFKVRSSADSGSAYEFTSQLFFQEERTDEVYQQTPYNTRGARSTRSGNDGIYGQSDGQTLMAVSATNEGYSGTFNIALYID